MFRKFDHQNLRFEVEEAFNPVNQRGAQVWSVDLPSRYCQCGRFQAFHFPCSNVIAAYAHVHIRYEQYIDPKYRLDCIMNAYSYVWFPVGNEEGVPSMYMPWTLVPDDLMLRPKGRPKSTRIRNEMDWRETQPSQRCGLCRSEGHNRRHYPQRAR